MDNKTMKLMCLLSVLSMTTSCKLVIQDSSSTNQVSTNSTTSSTKESSTTTSSSKVSSSSSLSSSSSSSDSSSSTVVLDDEDKYYADPEKRVTVKINVSLPESANDVYVIGDFNNWGKFNSLNDESYKVNNGFISLSNVENGESYSYMFVQRVTDATYTYNFGLNVVDSAGNNIIGYTKDGELISQYCITQVEDKFSFVASDNLVVTSTVTNWTDPIYGTRIEYTDPDLSGDAPTVGYSLHIIPIDPEKEPYYLSLEALNETDGEGRRQYVAYNVKLEAFDAFTIYDANSYTEWGEKNVEPYGAGANFAFDAKYGVVSLVDGTYNIYVKLAYENNRVYIEEAKSGEIEGDQGGTGTIPTGAVVEAPTTGYALYVTSEYVGSSYYFPLTKTENFGDYEQYFGSRLSFTTGDVFVLYNCSVGESWVDNIKLDTYSASGWAKTTKGFECSRTGTYDIYAKFKYADDNIYIGNS